MLETYALESESCPPSLPGGLVETVDVAERGMGMEGFGLNGVTGMTAFNRIYVGRTGRDDLRGRLCRVVATWRGRGPHNVAIEFENGERVICPVRCIRKEYRSATRATKGE